MLKVDDLQGQIKAALSNIVPPAIERCILGKFPKESEIGHDEAKKFAQDFDDMVSDQLASSIANAIDYYIKNIGIFGIVMVSPLTHIGFIVPQTEPIKNGIMPNTLGLK